MSAVLKEMFQSLHQRRIERFMKGAKQEVPLLPATPSAGVRLLRARLIWEEMCELIIGGLGVDIGFSVDPEDPTGLAFQEPKFYINNEFSMEELVDGCCDLSVVTIGTLSACGVPDEIMLEEVDNNNLEKIEKGTIRDDGKLIKPEGHQPPRIKERLEYISRKIMSRDEKAGYPF